DAVGGDAVRRAFEGGRLGQSLQAVFGGHVRRLVGGGAQAVHRGDVDDPAPFLPVHVGQGSADQPEGRFQHHGQHGVEDIGRKLLDGPDQLDPRVVDEHVGTGRYLFGGVQVGQVE